VRVSRTALWISCGTLVVTLLGIVPGYLVFFDKPDLVYETLIENIPLPKDLPGQLPDTLVILTVQNVGRRPSVDLQGSVTVGGDLIEYQVQGPNPAFGQVSHSRNGPQVLFNCSRLAPGDYPIKILAWYRGASSGPDVGVSDARGAGRKVSSIGAETAKYRGVGSGVIGLLIGLLGSFAAIGAIYDTYSTRKRISAAALEIMINSERVGPAVDQTGTATDRAPRDVR
jgi:hypothetical protein